MDTQQVTGKPEFSRKRCWDAPEMLSSSKKNRTLHQTSEEFTFQTLKSQTAEIWGSVGSVKHLVPLEAKMVHFMDNIGRGL